MPRKTVPKPYHHGNLYETLVSAGIDLLNDEGLSKFTLRECARRAGVSHAAPKNHFATVEDLLCEIAARGFDRFVAELDAAAAAASSQSPDQRLIAMGRAYVTFATANSSVYLLMFRHAQGFSKSAHLEGASRAAWVQLETAVAAVIGRERTDRVSRAAHVWALVHGIASLIIDRRVPGPIDFDEVIAQSLATLPNAIRGLGSA
jgi:AcrR family transcriptional regulator